MTRRISNRTASLVVRPSRTGSGAGFGDGCSVGIGVGAVAGWNDSVTGTSRPADPGVAMADGSGGGPPIRIVPAVAGSLLSPAYEPARKQRGTLSQNRTWRV